MRDDLAARQAHWRRVGAVIGVLVFGAAALYVLVDTVALFVLYLAGAR